ncbi:hypothetical protein MAH1_20740 [Sessilibacter sp. MAH1]
MGHQKFKQLKQEARMPLNLNRSIQNMSNLSNMTHVKYSYTFLSFMIEKSLKSGLNLQ